MDKNKGDSMSFKNKDGKEIPVFQLGYDGEKFNEDDVKKVALYMIDKLGLSTDKIKPDEYLVKKAERVASKAHQFQFRKDHVTPAICHPRNVVNYLKGIGIADEDILCSAWLHDTVEDCSLPLDYIGKVFGSKIKRIVKKLTKDGNREKYKKVIKNSDYDVQIIKLADTLDNCSHLDDPCLPKDLVERKVNDCKSLYLPMAERICPRFYSMLLERINGIEGFSKKDWKSKVY